MKNSLKYIFILFFALIPVSAIKAQTLPLLPKAGEITTGELPNGISYYLVENDKARGFADFALIQSGIPDERVSRRALSELPHFYERVPYRFLTDCGIGYGRKGFVSYSPESTRFDFRQVPVYRENVADSLLMMMFDIAGTSGYRQAIIVSGDISASKILERIKVLSMVVDTRIPYVSREEYRWAPADSTVLYVSRNGTAGTAEIKLVYGAERVARENMNTIIPLVSRMYSYELSVILSHRIRKAFRKAGITLADMSCRYFDSSQGDGDERYSFSVFAQADSLGKAVSVIASTLSDLDSNGVTREEFAYAKDRMVSHYSAESGRKPGNEEYVDKCAASWLYGSTLASSSTLNEFVSRKYLSEERELELFNNFVSAVLDKEKNLSIRCDVPGPLPGKDYISRAFKEGWDSASRDGGKSGPSDSPSISTRASKLRLKTEAEDNMSGSKLWTFQNGMKVIFKKADTPGEFRYALLLRGGFSAVPGLKQGEGPFVEEMFPLCSIAGMKGPDFFRNLKSDGIEMKWSVSVSDMRIRGKAPKNKLDMTIQTLLTVAEDRKQDREAFEEFRKREFLKADMKAMHPKDFNAIMDSIAMPDNLYSSQKSARLLDDDFQKRCEQYFSRQFDKTADGILVLVGDLGEDDTKKELSRTLGNFNTSKKYAPRPGSTSPMKSGTVTRFVESSTGLIGGQETGMNLALSAAVDFNLKNVLSFKIAGTIMEKVFKEVLADYGTYTEVSDRIEIVPSERFCLFVNCRPCFESGLPENVSPQDPLIILGAVRRAILSSSGLEIPETDLNAYKNMLKHIEAETLKNPDELISRILTKYSEGKDTVTGFEEAVNSVSAESVKAIIDALCNGAVVEYVVL